MKTLEEKIKVMSAALAGAEIECIMEDGNNRWQLASCFLLEMKDDSVLGIYDTITQVRRNSLTGMCKLRKEKVFINDCSQLSLFRNNIAKLQDGVKN